ncbi:MAG: hypothetical protein U0V54_00040 [Saprospiraceae bacterium]|nr:hypothetical protein [Bacteroidales bacterium]
MNNRTKCGDERKKKSKPVGLAYPRFKLYSVLFQNFKPQNLKLTYNFLNLPSKIEWSTTKSIEFIYSASGEKLAKTVKTGATINYIQHYVGGIEYNSASGLNRRVEAIYHGEGRFFNTNTGTTTPTYRTEFSIKDHLGNARVTFTDLDANGKIDVTNNATTNEINQENHYYAFGMAHEGPWMMNDRLILPARQKSSATKALDREGTATNRIAASRNLLWD